MKFNLLKVFYINIFRGNNIIDMIKYLIFIFLSLSTLSHSQCKVLVNSLQGDYEGECKKGLAHGQGIAKGIDTYTGEFKKGYPNGKGTYVWSNGDVFEGEFQKGIKQGFGILKTKDSTKEGYWRYGYYVGTNKGAQAYKIINKKYVNNYTFKRIGDGNKISIKWVKGSRVLYSMTGLNMTSSSGIESNDMTFCGFNQIKFPFQCRLNYQNTDKAETMTYDCIFDFEIVVPGEYELIIKD